MKYKNDILLISGLLLACLALFLIMIFHRNTISDILQIYGNGTLLLSVPTDQTTYVLLYARNDSYEWRQYDSISEAEKATEAVSNYNLICIDQGVASVCDADCSGRDCIRQKEISQNGESIICLPHKVLLCLTGAVEKTEDAVTW